MAGVAHDLDDWTDISLSTSLVFGCILTSTSTPRYGATDAVMPHGINYLKFLKLWRLGRVVRQFGSMNNRAARALYLFVSFLLINHLFCCAYFWMVVTQTTYDWSGGAELIHANTEP